MDNYSLVYKMNDYIQHGNITTYQHCKNVAKLCETWNEKYHLNADKNVLYQGALLHDFFLYDWHDDSVSKKHGLHGFTHAETAAKNAKKYFHVSNAVSHIIKCHMWPLNLFSLPKTKEAWMVCMADKVVSTKETLTGFLQKHKVINGCINYL